MQQSSPTAVDHHLSRHYQCAPGLFFTLRCSADGHLSLPFVAGRLELLHGLTPARLAEDIGPWLAACAPEDVLTLRTELAHSAQTMSTCRCQLRIGEAVLLQLEATPEKTAVASHVDWHGFIHDISERLHAETLLHASARLQEQLLSVSLAVPGFLYTTHIDADGTSTFPFVSDGIEELFGLRPEEIRQDANALRARYHPEDLPGLFARIAESRKTLEPFRHELRIFHPEHGLRWVEMRSIPRPLPGGKIEAHGLMLDITERMNNASELQNRYEQIVELNQQMEETARDLEEHAVELEATHEQLKLTETWYRNILHSAPDGMLVINGGGTIILVNAELCRMFGYSEHELLGASLEMLLPPDIRDTHAEQRQAFTRDSLHSKGTHCISNLQASHQQGWLLDIDISLSALPDSDFGDGSVCIAIRDVSERRRMEAALAAREYEFRTLVENADDVVVRYDTECRRTYVNPAWERMHGLTASDACGKQVIDRRGKLGKQAEELNALLRRVMQHQVKEGLELQWLDDNGQTICFQLEAVPELDRDGKVVGAMSLSRNLSERKRAETMLEQREREFRTLLENTPDTIARFDRDLRRKYVNPALARFLGRKADELIGQTTAEFPGGPSGQQAEEQLRQVFATGEVMEFEYFWVDSNGNEICSLMRMAPEFDEHGKVKSVLAVGRDITELNHFRKKIHQMAFYDTLTGQPNRALFNDRLGQMIADASWHDHMAGVMMIDLDRFKAVNDTMGHAVGDDLLREAASRINECVRSYDTVARLGGDEFAILLPEVRAGADLGRIASKILARFDTPFLLDGKEVFVSCSIGIALYPDDGTDGQDLLKFADSALYFAKRSGRNNFRFYAKDLTATAQHRLTLESELRHALQRTELVLHYQPKVSLFDGRITGSEALLRWISPQRGMVPPDQFIRIAEDTGLIIDIGKWVLQEACRTAASWNTTGQPLHKVAINLSPRQFQAPGLVATVDNALSEAACRPEWIELEITESLLLDEDGQILDILQTFRNRGISIAIDDFGTGYSALSYLARFPIDTLKIDRSFISTITTDKYRAELVRAILSIARCLGQEVVAEGVETPEQANFLAAHGCQTAQGFLFSKAVPARDFLALPKQFKGLV
jgi:diguanylate cyclase (GGDEF)-like protein/PAS domain S-box-containing protein